MAEIKLNMICYMIKLFMVISVYNKYVMANEQNLCLKGSCIHAAHNLLLNMDLSAENCRI